MRNLSRTMIGLALGAAIILPTVAQAQERGRDRGAMMNGDARREAFRQAREANRAVERPAPVAPQRVAPPQTPQTPPRGFGGDRGWNRGGDNRGGDAIRQRDANPGAPPSVDRQRNWGRDNRDTATGGATIEDRRRVWNRDGRNDRADQTNRPDRGDRNWTRDRDRDTTRDQRWSSDRRDWNREGWNRDGRNWDRNDRDRNWNRNDRDRRDWADRDRRGNDRWDRNWRTDRRYDWRDYRNRNRTIYRLPRYVAPRWGYSYQRWYPGYRWDPWFYGSSYWISDPWYYRLPPAYGDYRWVRYYDDAVLVDIETGEIIDIIYSFFF
ncbi:RcnB family protein [Rhizorhabdus histidinilytica]|uniref:Regulator RcnB of Ni and Co efflux n=1 Tax=Rhizorhabdus histidinilytica TaxID=439228 RepID=A0A1T5AYJ8_9SPHN|nr:RcnB family protein [Rhizorhabdus histidinilytica]SKB40121.1 regulator RcnB of Ni and Co efflux [Rhizorhabdus histidinilytica]